MDSPYQFFAIQIAFICPECRLTSKIRNFTDSHTCPHCNAVQPLFWNKDNVLLMYLYQCISDSLDKENTVKTALDRISLEVEKTQCIPCIECTQPLDLFQSSENNTKCNFCNTQNIIEKVSIPFFEFAFHTTKTWNKDKSISPKCNSCGASLTVKNKSKVQECSFCNTQNILSDEIWHSFNPQLNLQPFYIAIENINSIIEKINQSSNEKFLMEYAQHFYYKIRISVAKNPNITVSVARILAQDKNYYVLETLKKHPSFNLWFEVKVFRDEKEAKQFAIDFPYETNPDLTLNEMLNLAKQKMPKRLTALCYNPAITPQVMKQIIKQNFTEAWIALSKRLDLSADIVLLLAKTDEEEVHYNIADNPALPEIQMEKFAMSKNKSIISALLKNPALPDYLKNQIKN
jgi:uncharacterized CHY-type Zn-finger protein